MDTSPEYIRMCELATEIQHRDLIGGDFYTGKNIRGYGGEGWNVVKWSDQKRVVGGITDTTMLIRHNTAEVIWLPRQDQLQEMVAPIFGLKYGRPIQLALHFAGWCHEREAALWSWSFEQLWLAFVMHEKYNKAWDGQEWKDEVADDLPGR